MTSRATLMGMGSVSAILHGGAVGLGPRVIIYLNEETPSGAIDSVNDTFTLAHTPTMAAPFVWTKNGARIYNGVGGTLTGATWVYAADQIPNGADSPGAADVHRVSYGYYA